MSNISQLFKQADSYRTQESRKLGLKELCDKLAFDAGWHTVYTPNNKSKVKDKVAYDRPFDTTLFFELLGRMSGQIINGFMGTGSLSNDYAEDKIYDTVLRFMNSYNPNKCICDAQVMQRFQLSVRQRAIECNYESNTLYSHDSSCIQIKDSDGNLIGYKMKSYDDKIIYKPVGENTLEYIKYIAELNNLPDPNFNCCIEVSLDSEVTVGKNQETKPLSDLIADTRSTKDFEDLLDMQELEAKYSSNESQKILLRLLVDIGSKTSPAKLLREYIRETGKEELTAKKEVFTFYKNLKAQLSRA